MQPDTQGLPRPELKSCRWGPFSKEPAGRGTLGPRPLPPTTGRSLEQDPCLRPPVTHTGPQAGSALRLNCSLPGVSTGDRKTLTREASGLSDPDATDNKATAAETTPWSVSLANVRPNLQVLGRREGLGVRPLCTSPALPLHAGAWGPWQEMGSGQEAQTPARRPHGVPVLPWTGHLTSVGLWDPPRSLPGLGWGSSEIRPGEMGLFLYRFVWRFWGLNRASALPPNHTLARDAKIQR